MKKINLFVCLGVLSCLISCSYYKPEKDYSERLSKNEYKSFESLNNPMIFKFDARLKFNPRDISRDRGSYYFIYDWENELIYDYVYSPKDDSFSQALMFQCKNKDNNLEYFVFDYFNEEKIRVFSMESNKNSVEESFLNNQSMLNSLEFENVTQSKKDYQILINKAPDEIKFIYFDVNSKSITKTKKIDVNVHNTEFFVDSNGICWYLERFENTDDGKVYEKISSYDFATDIETKDYFVFDCVGDSKYDKYDGWINEDFYHFEYVDSDYIVCKKNSYDRSKENQQESKSYIVINKKDKSTTEFELDNPNDFLNDFVKIQNDYYIITKNYTSEEFEIQKINLETFKRESLVKQNLFKYSKIETRDNRIYFIYKTEDNIQKAEIKYFDVLENKFHECETLVLEEYFEKLGV